MERPAHRRQWAYGGRLLEHRRLIVAHLRIPVTVAAVGVVALLAAPAAAFQVKTSATSGCHELITAQAVEEAGWPDGAEAPSPDEDSRRALDDVPFDLPASLRDAWGLALLIGARHNDVGSANPFDFAALSETHNDPARQPEHCIRKKEHDGQEGDAQALAACHAFIMGELEEALGEGDDVDMARTETVETRLVFRGRVELELISYPFHLGMAVHALQDSYTHTFRRADDERVRHVLNWIEGNVGDSYDIDRDGHQHLSELDVCTGGVGARRRRTRALAASAELMAAVADPDGGRAGRLERAAAVLDRHMLQELGCVAANDWCGSPEAAPAASCSSGGGSGRTSALLILLAVALLASRRRTRAASHALAIAWTVTTGADLASAQPAPAAEPAPAVEPAPEPKTEEEVDEEKIETSLDREEGVMDRLPDHVSQRFGAAVNAGAAFDRGAGAVSAGFRWNALDRLGVGLDLEYNPWFSISAGASAPGAASLYVPIIWKLKRIGTWELRSTFYAGASMLLFDLVGIDKGQIGLFVGWNPLGLALPIGTHTKLIIKPGDIAIPAPQLTGIPFYYHQYRFTVGLEWYP